MTDSTATLPLQKLEEHFDIPGLLVELGYASIFGILQKSRKEFTDQHQGQLGENACKIYDTAASYATQIIHKLRGQNRPVALNAELQSGEGGNNLLTTVAGNTSFYSLPVTTKSGPTWQKLFADNWQEYCQYGSPEAVDSPVSYLSWMYNQAMSFERQMGESSVISLHSRRPDLQELVLDNDAINQVVPALNLVNEIIEQSVTPYVESKTPTKTVNEVLSTTRYPSELPYHYPHQQTLLSLESGSETLQDVIKKTDTAWPYFVKDNLRTGNAQQAWETGSNLAPEQMDILQEQVVVNETFYTNNFGLKLDDYTPFALTDTFCRHTDISQADLEKLIASTQSGCSVVASVNYPAETASAKDYGARFINQSGDDAISFIHEPGYDVQTQTAAMTLTNVSTSEGKFGKGIMVDASIAAEAYFPDTVSMSGDNPANYTIAFWCKLPADVKDGAILLTNKTGEYVSTTTGSIILVKRTDNKIYLEVSICDGTNVCEISVDIPVDTWIFCSLSRDISKNVVRFYYSLDGLTLNHYMIDVSTLGKYDIKQSYWGFNGNKNDSHFKKYPDNGGIVYFDDITVWSKVLTEDETVKFITSGIPAADYNTMVHHFPLEPYRLDNLSDSRMDYINRMIRLQRWLDIPYDQVDSLIYASSKESPKDNSLVMSGTKTVPGKFGNGIEVNAIDKAEVYFSDNISEESDVSKDFSLGFWCKIPSNVNDQALVTTNKTSNYAGSARGITLFALHTNNNVQLQLEVSDGATQLKKSVDIETDTWIYICLSSTADKKIVTCHYCIDGKTLNSFACDYSSINNIAPAGKYWGLNGNKDSHYYNSYSDRRSVFYYDDITTWNKALTEDEIANLAAGRFPAGGYTSMENHYHFDNIPTASVDPRRLAVFRHYQNTYNVSPQQFSAVLGELSPYALAPDVPFLDQVFNSSNNFDEPFKITNTSFNYTVLSGDDSRIIKQLCAGLGITRSQFLYLAKELTPTSVLPCSLPIVSALYRLVMVPRWLGLTFNEGIALLMLVENGNALNRLASVPVYTPAEATEGDLLDTLMALSDAAQWLSDNNLTATGMLALMQTSERVLPATTEELNFIAELNQQIPAVCMTEDSFRTVTKPGLNTLTGTVFTPVYDSPTGNGFELDSNQKQYCQVNSEINSHINGENSYTLGTWIRFPEKITNDTPALLNSTIYTDASKDVGIYILANANNHFVIVVRDTNKTAKNPSKTLGFTPGSWLYLALSMDVTTKKMAFYTIDYATQKVDSATLDWSDLSGSIIPEGNSWSLNEDGSLNYYETFNTRKGIIQYDNLTVWNKVLTEDQIKQIAASNQKAGGRTDYLATTTLDNVFDWMTCLDNVVDSNGIVYSMSSLPGEKGIEQIHNSVLDDIKNCIFPNKTHDQIAETLSGIIQTAKQSQDGIADSALAKALNIDHSYPPYLLSWAGASEYELLKQSLTLKGITSPDAIPNSYQQYLYQIARRSGLAATFGLTPATLSAFLAEPEWFGVADTAIDFNLTYLLSRYSDWLKLADKEDDMLAYLHRVNSSPTLTKEAAASNLAILLDWESDEVQQAAEHANSTKGIATTLQHIDTVMRLKDLCSQTGTSVETVVNVGNLTTSSNYQKWQSVGESLIAAQSNH